MVFYRSPELRCSTYLQSYGILPISKASMFYLSPKLWYSTDLQSFDAIHISNAMVFYLFYCTYLQTCDILQSTILWQSTDLKGYDTLHISDTMIIYNLQHYDILLISNGTIFYLPPHIIISTVLQTYYCTYVTLYETVCIFVSWII
jgi:hypothetical protein